MTTPNDIAASVKRCIAEQFGISANDLTTNTTLEDLGADSLDVAEVAITIEDELHISIPDEDLDFLLTVGGLITLVERALADGAEAAS